MSNKSTFIFTIPKNTPANFPKVGVFEVWQKRLKSITVIIPPGHKGLAFFQLSTPGYQVVPAVGSSSIYINGDSQTFEYTPDIDIPGPPYSLVMKGYNLDTFLDHSFNISVTTE